MTVPAISAADAASAYGRVDAGQPASMEGFGNALTKAMQGVVDAGHAADAKSAEAISGTGNLTEVVTAVNRAELALQTHGRNTRPRRAGVPGHHEDADLTPVLKWRRAWAKAKWVRRCTRRWWSTLKMGGPTLLAALAVGVLMSLVQAVTQINEATLAFVPKAAVIIGDLALTGPFMLSDADRLHAGRCSTA